MFLETNMMQTRCSSNENYSNNFSFTINKYMINCLKQYILFILCINDLVIKLHLSKSLLPFKCSTLVLEEWKSQVISFISRQTHTNKDLENKLKSFEVNDHY